MILTANGFVNTFGKWKLLRIRSLPVRFGVWQDENRTPGNKD